MVSGNFKPMFNAAKKQEEKKWYKCMLCGKTFAIKAKFAKRCPYCGNESVDDYRKADDAQKLIDDAGKRIYDN